jgi:hypothetical protein
VAPVMEEDLLAEIEAPARGPELDAQVRRRAETLVAALGDRERLFELRSLFILRLHRSSDDFGATEGLRVVERAIAMVTARPALGATPLPSA